MVSLSLQTGFLSGELLYFINLVIVTLIILFFFLSNGINGYDDWFN